MSRRNRQSRHSRHQQRRMRSFLRRPLRLPRLHHRHCPHQIRHGVMVPWFLSWKLGSYTQNAIKNRDRENEIEQWTDDIFRPAPNLPTVKTPVLERPKSSFFPNKSRFTPKTLVDERPATSYKPGERRPRYGTPRQGSTSNL